MLKLPSYDGSDNRYDDTELIECAARRETELRNHDTSDDEQGACQAYNRMCENGNSTVEGFKSYRPPRSAR